MNKPPAPDHPRRLFLAVVAPSFALSVSVQGLMFLLPLYVLELGGAAGLAAALVGMRGLGMLLMDLPAGLLAAHFGDKRLMFWSALATGLCAAAFALTREAAWFALLATLLGASSGAWLLGRLSYVTDWCPPASRGRVIAVLAGTMRAGTFVGPAAGGLLARQAGYETMFIVAGIIALLAGAMVLVFAHQDDARHHANPQSLQLAGVLREHRGVLVATGGVAVSLMLLRGARPVLVSLFGHQLGLDAASIGLIYSLAAGIDMLLFYPAGLLMDRRGRLWAAVPSLVLMGAGCALLPMAGGAAGLLAVTLLLGVGNGISTGVVMTMGSDLAPPHQRGAFLGLWRVLSDAGVTGGPMLVAAAVHLAGLAVAAGAVGLVGGVGALLALTVAGETLGRQHKRDQ